MNIVKNIRLYFELKDFLNRTPFELKYNEWTSDDLMHVYHTENASYTLDDKDSSLRFWVRERNVTKRKKPFKTEYALHIKHNDGALCDIEPHFVNHGLLAKTVFRFCAIYDNQRA